MYAHNRRLNKCTNILEDISQHPRLKLSLNTYRVDNLAVFSVAVRVSIMVVPRHLK